MVTMKSTKTAKFIVLENFPLYNTLYLTREPLCKIKYCKFKATVVLALIEIL